MCILIPLSALEGKSLHNWHECCQTWWPEQCVKCSHRPLNRHAKRPKQAHDAYHTWITVRRALCKGCKATFTILPPLSPPYTHYSLVTRWEAAILQDGDKQSAEACVPPVQDPDRSPDPRTIRRWLSNPAQWLRNAPAQPKRPGAFRQWMRERIAGRLDLAASWSMLRNHLPTAWPLRC